jgi:hypothetical protein
MLSQVELEAAPKITLGKHTYAIPMLAPRQNRLVVPKLLAMMKQMTGDDGKTPSALALDTASYDELLDLTWVAITRAQPTLTKEEFLDRPVTLMELIVAMDVISQQCGVLKRQVGAPPVGEAQAGQTSISTGIVSSPE